LPRTIEIAKGLRNNSFQRQQRDTSMKRRRSDSNSTRLKEDPIPYRTNGSATSAKLRFVDLFCGIGGFRIAFDRAGCQCVFSSDYDKFSQLTYEANFGEKPHGDIYAVDEKTIPKFDILCAGFPCQPFSLAGVSKKNSLGRKHGFEDKKQGNLFFRIADIIACHRPGAFVLENVKNLRSHDKGETYKRIMEILQDQLGYHVPPPRIIDARSVVPQHRERIFIVGFREVRHFEFPTLPSRAPTLASILEADVPAKYTLTDHLWNYLQEYAKKHQAAGNGFGFGLFTGRDIARTLSARYHKDGSEILISQGKGRNPRRLMPSECAKLMGFPENFKIPVSDTQAYRQFGNSVVVPVVEAIAHRVVETLRRPVNDKPVLTLEFSEKANPGFPGMIRQPAMLQNGKGTINVGRSSRK
jgi:DNA (cytosine-5)-methyltransferase 1